MLRRLSASNASVYWLGFEDTSVVSSLYSVRSQYHTPCVIGLAGCGGTGCGAGVGRVGIWTGT